MNKFGFEFILPEIIHQAYTLMLLFLTDVFG